MSNSFVGANTEEDDVRGRQQAVDAFYARLKMDWQDVNRQDLVYFLESAQYLTVPPGKVIYRQGEPVLQLYLLISGRAQEARTIETPAGTQEFSMRDVGEKSLLGVYDLVYRKPHSTSARTQDICQLVAIDAQDMHRLLHRFPVLRLHLLPVARYGRLRTIPLLSHADDVQVTFIADAAQILDFRAGETIYQAGDPAEKVYLIDEGMVRLEHEDAGADDARTRWLGNGGEFGMGERLSAGPGDLYPLDHSATAVTSVRAFVLKRSEFFIITGASPEQLALEQRRLRSEAIANVETFRAWSDADRDKILGYMSHYYIPHNHLLTQQGEIVDSLWVLLKGKPALVLALGPTGEAIPDSRVEGPAYFNEGALRQQLPATSSLEAEAGSEWLRLHWRDFQRFVRRPGGRALSAALRMPDPAGAPVVDAQAPPRYDWLEAGERIVEELRRHWIVALAQLVPAILLSLLAGLLASAAIWNNLSLTLFGGFSWLAVGFWIVLPLALLAWVWGVFDYQNDFLIVTNTRVMRQEKILFFSQMRQMAPLEKVQDVTVTQHFWGNLLGYATLEIQTAGTTGNIVFDRAANFETIATEIKREANRRKSHYRAIGKKEIYSLLENRFGVALKLPSRVVARVGSDVEEAPEVDADAGIVARLAARWLGADRYTPPAHDPERQIVWHKHWFILLRNLVAPGLLLLLLAAGVAALWLFPLGGSLGNMLLIFTAWLAVFAAGWLWWNIEDWRNDKYILENDQLIDIARKPLGVETQQRSASLSQIVDIRLSMPSPLHYILNFGSVYVQTAATDGSFTFDSVSNPLLVVEAIRRRMDQNQQAEQRLQALQRAQELPDWLEAYSRLDPNQDLRAQNSTPRASEVSPL